MLHFSDGWGIVAIVKRNYYIKYPEAKQEHDPYVSVVGVARHYRITSAAVSNWVVRYDDFPQPAVVDDSGHIALWRLSDIQSWHDATLKENKKSLAKRS